MDEIQILSVIDSYDGVAQSGKNKGQPYTKKTLSIMWQGKPTEVSVFVDPDKDYYFNVGEFYEGNVVNYRDKLTFKPTDKIIKSDEPTSEPTTTVPPAPDPAKYIPPPKATPPAQTTELSGRKIYTQQRTIPDDTKEATYISPEQTKSKFIKEANILNNAVSIVSALISISQPISGGDNDNKIQFGNSHHNVSDLLQAYIKKFQKYYKDE